MSDPQWGQPGQPPVPEAPTSFGPPPATGPQWAQQTEPIPPGVAFEPGPVPTEVAKTNMGGWVLLAVGALALLVIGLSIPEDDIVGWEVGAWAVFAVACCLALFVPLFAAAFNLTADRAWRVAAGGAVGLFAFWLLIIVPKITMNTSFIVTAATAAAAGAVWLAPGRPEPPA